MTPAALSSRARAVVVALGLTIGWVTGIVNVTFPLVARTAASHDVTTTLLSLGKQLGPSLMVATGLLALAIGARWALLGGLLVAAVGYLTMWLLPAALVPALLGVELGRSSALVGGWALLLSHLGHPRAHLRAAICIALPPLGAMAGALATSLPGGVGGVMVASGSLLVAVVALAFGTRPAGDPALEICPRRALWQVLVGGAVLAVVLLLASLVDAHHSALRAQQYELWTRESATGLVATFHAIAALGGLVAAGLTAVFIWGLAARRSETATLAVPAVIGIVAALITLVVAAALALPAGHVRAGTVVAGSSLAFTAISLVATLLFAVGAADVPLRWSPVLVSGWLAAQSGLHRVGEAACGWVPPDASGPTLLVVALLMLVAFALLWAAAQRLTQALFLPVELPGTRLDPGVFG